MFVDAQSEIADHVLVEAELALHLDDGRRRRVDIEQREMRLAVFLDAEGEGLDAPIFDLGDRTAMSGQNAFQLFRQSFDLLGGHVLTRHIDMLVKSHDEPFFSCCASAPR